MVRGVRLPEVPLTWIENVPVVALLLADRVSVLVPVVLEGLKDAVTPCCRPEADKLTLPVKPFCAVTLMLDVTLPPRARLNEFGEAESSKFGGGAIVREIATLCDNPPDAPVIVTENVPRAAVLLAVRVSVHELVALVGLSAAVTPLGRPDAEKVTPPLNPFTGLIVIVVEPAAPWRKLKLVGDADSVKLGCGAEEGQLFTKLAALTVPMPVAKSHPTLVPYAGAKELLEVESTPTAPSAR